MLRTGVRRPNEHDHLHRPFDHADRDRGPAVPDGPDAREPPAPHTARRGGAVARAAGAARRGARLARSLWTTCTCPRYGRSPAHAPWWCRAAAAVWCPRAGIADVREVDAGERIEIAGVEIEATPALHDGRRWPFGPRLPSLGFVGRRDDARLLRGGHRPLRRDARARGYRGRRAAAGGRMGCPPARGASRSPACGAGRGAPRAPHRGADPLGDARLPRAAPAGQSGGGAEGVRGARGRRRTRGRRAHPPGPASRPTCKNAFVAGSARFPA